MKTNTSSVYLFLTLIVSFVFTLSGIAQVQIGSDIEGQAAYDESGYSVDMPDAYTVGIGAPGSNGRKGQVRVYKWRDSVWVQKGGDIIGEATSDNSGVSISMPDSNTVAVGAIFNKDNGYSAGHVRVYYWADSVWVQKGADIDGERGPDNSGRSVSMPDPNTLAIGAHNNSESLENAGHVRIYSWKDSIWEQKGMDIDGEGKRDASGWAVSMPDSNTVAIGAMGNNGNGGNAGHVRVYIWRGGVWIQKGADIDGEAAGDYSGASVSMPDTNTVAIGAAHNSGNGIDAGHVRVYYWADSAWVQKGADIDGEAAGDQSGRSISMPDANTLAIGAMYNDGKTADAGSVRIYSWYRNVWVKRGNDIDGQGLYDQSGSGVSMANSSTVAIGAMYNDGVGTKYKAGDVRVFSLCNAASSVDVDACKSFKSSNGKYIWNSSGVYLDTVSNYANCYDVVHVNLTVNSVDVSLSQYLSTIISNAAGASYQWMDCSNGMSIIPGDTNQSFVAVVNGSYAVQVAQNGCVDTSACFTINNVGLAEGDLKNDLYAYPNPTFGNVVINLGGIHNNIEVLVRNIVGKEVISNLEFKNSDKLEVFIPGERGVYFLEVNADGKNAVLKILKE